MILVLREPLSRTHARTQRRTLIVGETHWQRRVLRSAVSPQQKLHTNVRNPPTAPQVSVILAFNMCAAHWSTCHSLLAHSMMHEGKCTALIHTPQLAWFDHPFAMDSPGQNGTVQTDQLKSPNTFKLPFSWAMPPAPTLFLFRHSDEVFLLTSKGGNKMHPGLWHFVSFLMNDMFWWCWITLFSQIGRKWWALWLQHLWKSAIFKLSAMPKLWVITDITSCIKQSQWESNLHMQILNFQDENNWSQFTAKFSKQKNSLGFSWNLKGTQCQLGM